MRRSDSMKACAHEAVLNTTFRLEDRDGRPVRVPKDTRAAGMKFVFNVDGRTHTFDQGELCLLVGKLLADRRQP